MRTRGRVGAPRSHALLANWRGTEDVTKARAARPEAEAGGADEASLLDYASEPDEEGVLAGFAS